MLIQMRSYQRLVLVLILAVGHGRFSAASPTPRSAQPNLVVVLADDLGCGDLAGAGATDLRTPHLDELFRSGMRFERFYANCPVCSPTRAALLSGRYPDLVGVPGVIRTHPQDNWGYLSPAAVLLPTRLGSAGYHTALVGKWHLGLESPNTPTERGFDFFHGFLGDMMDDYYDHRRHGHNYMRRNLEEIDPPGHATDLFTQWTVDYLRSRAATSQPFFLYLAYNAPHTPIQPPEDWLRRVEQREKNISPKRARLAALIEHLDDRIGQVIAALKETGQFDRTLLVFTSDNGGQLDAGASCGSLRGGKQDLYEGGIRVPFCAVWPGHIPPGSVSREPALTMDLFPTLCAAAGADVAAPIDGVSLLSLMTGKSSQLQPRHLFWMRREGGSHYQGQDYYAVRSGDWKLVHNYPFEPYQLYQLADDPREERDLAGSNRPVFNELSSLLRDQIRRAGAVPWQKP